jgi:hypothetical protein
MTTFYYLLSRMGQASTRYTMTLLALAMEVQTSVIKRTNTWLNRALLMVKAHVDKSSAP